jgi:hypothetical protein
MNRTDLTKIVLAATLLVGAATGCAKQTGIAVPAPSSGPPASPGPASALVSGSAPGGSGVALDPSSAAAIASGLATVAQGLASISADTATIDKELAAGDAARLQTDAPSSLN